MKLKQNPTPRRQLTMRTKRAITGYMFILPFIIGFLLFILKPILSSLQMSFSEVTINTDSAGFTMHYIGIENYLKALTVDPQFNRLLVESLESLIIDVPAIIIFSMFVAVLLNREFKGRGLVRAIFFMPVIIASGVVLGMDKSNALMNGIEDLQQAASNTSITDTVEQLLLGAFGSNFGLVEIVTDIINHIYDIAIASSIQTIIFLSGLQAISPSIYEASRIDGCSAWEMFWKITLPMLSPMILVNWIYTIVDRFVRSDNEVMVKILEAINPNLEYGFSSAMAWIYCIAMLLVIGISAAIISRMVYYYD